MKYNKQLFDNIQKEYNQLLELAEFIYDQLLNIKSLATDMGIEESFLICFVWIETWWKYR